MKKTSLLLMMCLMAFSMNAQKFAVFEFRGSASLSVADVDGISEMFMTYFHPAGYTPVERAQIDKVIYEQGFQHSSLTEEQAVYCGEIMNVSKVVVGKVSMLGGQYQVDVRVVDVQSGHDAAFDGATFSGDYRANVRNLAQRLAGQIAITPGETVYAQPKPQQQPTEPFVIYGYLKVFPNDLGTFESEPKTVITRLNKAQQYGYGTWRLPTNEELQLMRANNVVGNGSYMTKEKETGIVRLVTDKEKGEVIPSVPAGYVDLGLPSGTLWKDKNESGFYSYDQAVSRFGSSLPSQEQLEELKSACEWIWNGSGYKVVGPNGASIVLPVAGNRDCNGSVVNFSDCGYYWSSPPIGSETVWSLYFSSSTVEMRNYSRCRGLSVRLVQ